MMTTAELRSHLAYHHGTAPLHWTEAVEYHHRLHVESAEEGRIPHIHQRPPDAARGEEFLGEPLLEGGTGAFVWDLPAKAPVARFIQVVWHDGHWEPLDTIRWYSIGEDKDNA